MKSYRVRSKGGAFGDNVEELDDSVGEILAALDEVGARENTIIWITSDNGPYQEEGYEKAGRTNVYDDSGNRLGRLKGGKGQIWEGGVRVPGSVVWKNVTTPGTVSDALVTTMDIFPTILKAAGVSLSNVAGTGYEIDGADMRPVLEGKKNATHDVFLHYCGFNILAARVDGRFKVFWATQKWYTHDKKNFSICTECCNGINPYSRIFAPASELCACDNSSLTYLDNPVVYDLKADVFESRPLTKASPEWPIDGSTYESIVGRATAFRDEMVSNVHPKPDSTGAGHCTAGNPNVTLQPCCPGCTQKSIFSACVQVSSGKPCSCDK